MVRRAAEGSWVLYVLECRDGSWYTGITNDLPRRLRKHRSGRGAAYTRSHRPVRVVYHEPCGSRSAALRRECAVKRLRRPQKELLVRRARPDA